MAHSLEARVPFLDIDLVEFALRIAPSLKIDRTSQTEKWILRKAFEDILPDSVVWRVKTQFANGSGSEELLTRYAETEISDADFEAERKRYAGIDLRWKEELMYFRIFREHFGDNPSTLSTVGRWYE